MRANLQKSELQFTFDVVYCLLIWSIPYLDYVPELPFLVFNYGINHSNQIKMYLRNLIFTSAVGFPGTRKMGSIYKTETFSRALILKFVLRKMLQILDKIRMN